MVAKIKHQLTDHFEEEIRFFKSLMEAPKSIGAILPTSNITARKMTQLIDLSAGGPVLELGPGTGSITKAILAKGVLPENLYSVEFTQSFIPRLRENFPGVNFIQGDAFNLHDALPDMNGQKFNTIISAIPMLNFPISQRLRLLEDLFDLLQPGRPVVQFSYGIKSPIPANWTTYSVEPLDWTVLNVPPARLWVYRRAIHH